MVASTSKISNLIHETGTSKVNSEARTAVRVAIISLLATALLAFIVCLLGITPAWSAMPESLLR
jgi:hypothetical protein